MYLGSLPYVAMLSKPNKCQIGFTKKFTANIPTKILLIMFLIIRRRDCAILSLSILTFTSLPLSAGLAQLGLSLQKAEVIGLLCWPTCTTIRSIAFSEKQNGFTTGKMASIMLKVMFSPTFGATFGYILKSKEFKASLDHSEWTSCPHFFLAISMGQPCF